MTIRLYKNRIDGVDRFGYRKKDTLRWEFSIKRENYNHGGTFGKMIFIRTRKYYMEVFLDRRSDEVGVGGTERIFISKKRKEKVHQILIDKAWEVENGRDKKNKDS